MCRNVESVAFPKLDVDKDRVIQMMRNVSRNKGLSVDGVTD